MIALLLFVIGAAVAIWAVSATAKAGADRVRNRDWGRLGVAGLGFALPVIYVAIYGLN